VYNKQMDEQQQQRVNEAAQQFTSALVESFRAVSGRGERVQAQSAQLTQDFFNRVIENLRTQAEDTQQMTKQLVDQHQRATEAGRTLSQESVGAYMEFVNSMFSFWQRSTEAAQGGTEEAQRTTTEAPAESQEEAAELPLDNYDTLAVEQVSERLDDLSAEEIRQLRAYEAENRNRSTLLRRLDETIEAGSPS
jgi:hypothetical protein